MVTEHSWRWYVCIRRREWRALFVPLVHIKSIINILAFQIKWSGVCYRRPPPRTSRTTCRSFYKKSEDPMKSETRASAVLVSGGSSCLQNKASANRCCNLRCRVNASTLFGGALVRLCGAWLGSSPSRKDTYVHRSFAVLQAKPSRRCPAYTSPWWFRHHPEDGTVTLSILSTFSPSPIQTGGICDPPSLRQHWYRVLQGADVPSGLGSLGPFKFLVEG